MEIRKLLKKKKKKKKEIQNGTFLPLDKSKRKLFAAKQSRKKKKDSSKGRLSWIQRKRSEKDFFKFF